VRGNSCEEIEPQQQRWRTAAVANKRQKQQRHLGTTAANVRISVYFPGILVLRSVTGMNGNAELLNFIYQNSQMGVHTLEQLIGIVEDEKFKKRLESQYREYQEIHKAAQEMLNKNGYDEKGLSTFEKIRSYIMINMQTLTDKSSSHIAEMLIIGSNMGIIDAVKNIKKYQDAEPEIINLMKRLLEFEENNVQELKKFL